MANPPPPYDDITGISRAVMKDNAQVTIEDYNGNAQCIDTDCRWN
jgi:hypothetical protein